MAVICLQTQRPDEALELLQQLVNAWPDEPVYCDRMANLLERRGRTEAALACYCSLLQRQPDLVGIRFNYARLLKRCGNLEEALAEYERTLQLGISHPEEVYSNISVLLTQLQRDEEAQAALQSALQQNPEYVPALYNLALLHEEQGDWTRASPLLQRILELQPGHVDALVRLASGQSIPDPGHPLVRELLQVQSASTTSALQRESLNFALGKVFDDCGDYPRAFQHYQLGNEDGRRRLGPYERAAHEKLCRDIRAGFSSVALAGVEVLSREPLIFICGMFRSGSTLLEQALAAHPRLCAGGEINFFNLQAPLPAALSLSAPELQAMGSAYLEYLANRFPGQPRVSNKRPDNFLYLGLLRALFPNARFIHTRRQPLDTCVSVFCQQFEAPLTWTTDLLDIGHFYLEYRRLMEFWEEDLAESLVTLDYEQLVQSPEDALRPILAFCGVEWDIACLDFHKVDNRVRTASVTQVRQPLYQSSSGRWRNYAAELEPLRNYLQNAGIRV